MQVLFLKTDKLKETEKMKKRGIYYAFRPLFSLKRRAAEEQFCKN